MCIRTMFVAHSNIIVDFNTKIFHFMNVTFDFCSIKYFVEFMNFAHVNSWKSMKIFEFFVSNVFETTLIEILFRFEFFESNVFETTLIDLIFSKSFKCNRRFMQCIAFMNRFMTCIAFIILIAFFRIFSKRFEFATNDFCNCFKIWRLFSTFFFNNRHVIKSFEKFVNKILIIEMIID